MISHLNEYKLTNNQTVSIQFDEIKNIWEVACWNEDDSNHWYKQFKNKQDAEKEFEEWRN